MRLFEVQEMIVNAVANNTAFNDKVFTLFDDRMTYSIDQNEIESQDVYPIFMMHKNANIQDVQDGSHMILQFILAVSLGDRDTLDTGVTFYPSIRDIEIIAYDALDIIKSTVCTGMNYDLAHSNNIITTIGEADDVQTAMSFRLEKDNFI